jgi:hypothetical protein
MRYVVEFMSAAPITEETRLEIADRLTSSLIPAIVNVVAPWDRRLRGQVQNMGADTREALQWLITEIDGILIDIVPDRYVHAVGYEGLGCGG